MLAASSSLMAFSSPTPGPGNPDRTGSLPLPGTSPTMTQIPTPLVQIPTCLHVPRVGPSRFPGVSFASTLHTLVLGSAHASLPVMSRLRAGQPLDSLVCAELATALVEVDRLSLPYISLSRHPHPKTAKFLSFVYFFLHNALTQINCLPLEAPKIPPTDPKSYNTLTVTVGLSHGLKTVSIPL
ncbi:hypothetical protein LZ30DRAFT_707170, partial [Colletotrichum cereale]